MAKPTLNQRLARLDRLRDPERASAVLKPLGISVGFRVGRDKPSDALVVRQVHGTKIVEGNPEGSEQIADGLFLAKPGTIAVASADCLPILLACPGAPLIMALHAGWRSLSEGIVQEASRIWQTRNLCGEDFYGVLGPTLCRQHFEVGPEVVAAFETEGCGFTPEERALLVSRGTGDRSHVDLALAAAMMLLSLGLRPEGISLIESCTFCHPERWPSWRRDKKFAGSLWSSLELAAIS